MQINTNYDNLEQSYLFSTIARKVREYSASHPEADIIRLGIGDVTRPLVQFHPEFKSRPNRAHPLFKAFVAASLKRSKK